MQHKNSYQAYRKATHTVPKTRQVVMLYEGILRNLQQAREAIEANNIPERYNKLVRASEIIIGLQMSLDFDAGEQSAQALYDFYAALDARIMQLHRSHDLTECDAMIAEVRAMQEVWDKIDRGENVPDENAPQPPAPDAANSAAPEPAELTDAHPQPAAGDADRVTFSA